MSRILVVAYSRSENTRTVAQAIATHCHADFEEIRELRSRRGPGGYVRSAVEAWRRAPSTILAPRNDPADYDLVVLGSPVWVQHVSSPMRRYLLDHGSALTRTAHFVTEGGSGGQTALADMASLTPRAPIATLILTDAELRASLQAKIADFVAQIVRAASTDASA